jgi:hypothetical protein
MYKFCFCFSFFVLPIICPQTSLFEHCLIQSEFSTLQSVLSFSLAANPVLPSVFLPVLVQVNSPVEINSNSALTNVSLPLLLIVQGLVTVDNPILDAINMSALVNVTEGYLFVSHCKRPDFSSFAAATISPSSHCPPGFGNVLSTKPNATVCVQCQQNYFSNSFFMCE